MFLIGNGMTYICIIYIIIYYMLYIYYYILYVIMFCIIVFVLYYIHSIRRRQPIFLFYMPEQP